MRIVITGADGFIGRNLSVRLGELGHSDVVGITLDSSHEDLLAALAGAGFVFHLAGVNRPKDMSELATGNAGFTEELLLRLRKWVARPRWCFPRQHRRCWIALTA